jgi:hypothetical protein
MYWRRGFKVLVSGWYLPSDVLCVLLISGHFSKEAKWIKKGIFVLDKGETK